MAAPGSSMLYSFLLFVTTLSLQEMYRGKLASSELFTILGGFTSSLIFLTLLTFIGNYQETNGIKSGWGSGECILFNFFFSIFAILNC
nr:protein KRTCAP2 homolog [Ipomoea batatas]